MLVVSLVCLTVGACERERFLGWLGALVDPTEGVR